MMLNWMLSEPMQALVDGLERLGGRAQEATLCDEAAAHGENGAYGARAHFGKAIRELRDRGIIRGEMMGSRRVWSFTEEASRERGYTEARAPEGLF